MDTMQEKDLNPYEFTIDINGEPHAIRVEVPKAGDYIVYINGDRVGHIYPIIGNTTIQWKSKDPIDQELIDEIGKQIEVLKSNHL